MDLFMGLFFEGPFSAMAGGARKQPIKQPIAMALMGRFPSLMGRFPTLMVCFPDSS